MRKGDLQPHNNFFEEISCKVSERFVSFVSEKGKESVFQE